MGKRFKKRSGGHSDGPEENVDRKENVSHVSNEVPQAFTIRDERSGHDLLVDTGAFVSIFPVALVPQKNITQDGDIPTLVAANGSNIKTYGRSSINLRLAGNDFTWNFVVASVQQPLLGADFLAHFNLLVDIAGRRLLSSDTFSTLPLLLTGGNSQINSSVYLAGPYSFFFDEFKDVFRAELKQVPGASARHGIFHHIGTNGPPVHSRFRRLPPAKFQAAKEAFAEMERMGVCRKASSAWASPLHMVPKPDGSWRPCGDYRRLNAQTIPDHYPLPNIADVTGTLSGAKIFSKLDLLKGYFQVPVHPDDVDKTCIITPFGSYVFYFSTFGLRNSGATFQRLMDTLFGCVPFCIVYVDDILIFSKNHDEHKQHLRVVLQILQENGLVVRPDKCQFGATSIDFLGHKIDADGIHPLEKKVEAVKNFPTPLTTKSLQEYLGLLNYYHRFVPHVAGIVKPLYDALSGKNKSLKWGHEQEHAFVASKSALATATCLHHPIPDAPIVVTTDASETAVGAVLEQVVDGVHQPLAFFSKKLRPNEQKYSTFDRELLAVYLALRHFHHNLEGLSFTVRTDHKPLVSALSKTKDAFSARQQRQLSAISEFCCQLEHIPGNRNPAADALSRAAVDAVQLGIDFYELAQEQREDSETEEYRTTTSSLQWEDIKLDDNSSLLCDISTGRPRPLVPKKLRKQIFDIVHSLSHPSIRTTVRLMTSKYVWRGIARDVRAWARACDRCQRCKVTRHTETGIRTFTLPRRRFGHVHIDVVGPLAISNGYRYLFTAVDRATRWPEVIPLTEATSASCAQAFLNGWVARFGVPDDITSDRGTTFTSDLWKNLASLLGTRVHYTTSYNPESNGMVERFHRSLKQALMTRCATSSWCDQLPWIMLGLRTAPKTDSDVSPAETVYGENIIVPGEFFPSNNESESSELQHARRAAAEFRPLPPRQNHRETYLPPQLNSCSFVFVREDAHHPPLTPPYRGPYKVLQRSDKAFKITLTGGREDWVSIDRLKPAYLLSDLDAPTSSFGRPLHAPDRLMFS